MAQHGCFELITGLIELVLLCLRAPFPSKNTTFIHNGDHGHSLDHPRLNIIPKKHYVLL